MLFILKSFDMKTINESHIREMVARALRKVIKENFEGEYRTKGSLNKSTLEKQMQNVDKTSGAAPLGGEDYNPDWDDYTMDNIKGLYNDDEEMFDDTQAGGDYKADPSDPYFITSAGSREDADAIGQFHNDFAIIKKAGHVNFVDKEGHLVSKEWFDACNDFEDGLAVVSKGGKRNFLRSDGQLLLKDWVDRAGDFIAGRAPIIIQGQRREVDRNGKIY